MAAGMNWGILSLLGMIGLVLAGVAGFFVFLMRRSAAMANHNEGVEASADPVGQNPLLPVEGFNAGTPADRGNFGRLSALAQRRKQCMHSQPEPTQILASRGRS
jgi:hypothetical protein